MAAHSIVILRSGKLEAADLRRFQPLAGSPLHWGARARETR
jgi:hypothetical protein